MTHQTSQSACKACVYAVYQKHTACKQNEYSSLAHPRAHVTAINTCLLLCAHSRRPGWFHYTKADVQSSRSMDCFSCTGRHAFHLQLRCKNHTQAMILQEGMFGLREWEDEGFMPPTQDADDSTYDPSVSVRKARQPSARVYLLALDCCLLFHNSTFSTFLPCRCAAPVWAGLQ